MLKNIFGKSKIRLGVTGFARTGKTVFIGSLSHALLTADSRDKKGGLGPLSQFAPYEKKSFRCASVRNDIHTDLPQFPLRQVRDSLGGKSARWPVPTEGISHLVLKLDCFIKTRFFDYEKEVLLDLIDYPGEWIADFPMLEQDYHTWSDHMMIRSKKGGRAALCEEFTDAVSNTNLDDEDEDAVSRLAELWEKYLIDASEKGLVFNQPGRLLRPDNLRASPVLRLFPLPVAKRNGKLGDKMSDRFEEYKKKVIKPFYEDYFAKIDRQIVLVDILKTLQLGEEAFNELIDALRSVLKAFRYGKSNKLWDWLTGHNTTHLLFAVTKADHVVRGDRANLINFLKAVVQLIDEDNHLKSSVDKWDIMGIASVQATEDRMTVKTPKREVLYGKPSSAEKPGAWDPGGVPLDVPPDWDNLGFEFFQFDPGPMPHALTEGFPAINLGKALDFLIGEDLI